MTSQNTFASVVVKSNKIITKHLNSRFTKLHPTNCILKNQAAALWQNCQGLIFWNFYDVVEHNFLNKSLHGPTSTVLLVFEKQGVDVGNQFL